MPTRKRTLFKSFSYRGFSVQKLRNVSILNPCVIWVVNGTKRIVTENDVQLLRLGDVLFLIPNQKLVFENVPEKGYFSTRQISFLAKPSELQLEKIVQNGVKATQPVIIKFNESLQKALNLLHQVDTSIISENVQKYWLDGLYSLLAEYGLLHLLFPYGKCKFEDRVYEYLASQPAFKHKMNNVCNHFGISRATLIRRLKKSGTQFKLIVRMVRMNNAVYLMKNNITDVEELASICGYQSLQRFQFYFKEQFGISPKNYIKYSEGKEFLEI